MQDMNEMIPTRASLLRRLRARRGWISAAARDMGITSQAIQAFLRGETPVEARIRAITAWLDHAESKAARPAGATTTTRATRKPPKSAKRPSRAKGAK